MNSDIETFETFYDKENLWRKNELAHQILRKRNNTRPYCTFCRHRGCYDPTTVHGDKSLKKSKVVSCRTTKIDSCRWQWHFVSDPKYLNTRNGESYNDGGWDVLDECE